MKRFTIWLAIITLQQQAFAQSNVGIGTNNPNASAVLDISSNNKGLLIPRIYLQSFIDNSTIPSPATSLLIYNTNTSLTGGTGMFYNAGTAASPNWTRVGDLVLPYYKGTSTGNSAFRIDNFSQSSSSSAIRCYSAGGNALETDGKVKIAGAGQSPAQGKVLTSDANGNATWEGAVAFLATGVKTGGSEVIPGNAFVKVAFWNEKYDLGNNYNNTTVSPHSTFTAPVHGIYHFDVLVQFASNTESGHVFSLLLRTGFNGSISTLSQAYGGFGDYNVGQSIGIDVELNAGRQVWVEIYHNIFDTNLSLKTGAEDAHFNGMLKIKL